jgi:hypothetical protein
LNGIVFSSCAQSPSKEDDPQQVDFRERCFGQAGEFLSGGPYISGLRHNRSSSRSTRTLRWGGGGHGTPLPESGPTRAYIRPLTYSAQALPRRRRSEKIAPSPSPDACSDEQEYDHDTDGALVRFNSQCYVSQSVT